MDKKIVLLINVLLTPDKFTRFDRGILPSFNNVEIFKYMISSLSVLPFSKAFIYVSIDNCFNIASTDMESYIKNTMMCDVDFYANRNLYQREWQKSLEPIMSYGNNNTLVWFLCNHDHIFMDNNLSCINKIIDDMFCSDQQYLSCLFSHWTAHIATSFGMNLQANNDFSTQCTIDSVDSIQIVNKNVLNFWWYNTNYGDKYLGRTDFAAYAGGGNVDNVPMYTYIPIKEQCMHFDGYMLNDIYPALTIPHGFFDNNIKLNFDHTQHIDNYVNINPCLDNFTSVDKLGTDYKWIQKDIPLFWKNKISDMILNNDNIEQKTKCRNDNIILRIKVQCEKNNITMYDSLLNAIMKAYNTEN